MNETLSVRQANEIISKANGILYRCKDNLETRFNDFLLAVSKVWEDKNAVDFAKATDAKYVIILKNLTNNNGLFAHYITEIANMYIQTGNQDERISAEAQKYTGNLNYGVVKEYFSNTANADDFGFLDVNSSPGIIIDDFYKLTNDLFKCFSEMVDEMRKINAFGNIQVSLAVEKTAGELVEVLVDNVNSLKNKAAEYIIQTADNYKIGDEMAERLRSFQNSQYGASIGTPVQTKYAPPPAAPVIPVPPRSSDGSNSSSPPVNPGESGGSGGGSGDNSGSPPINPAR